MARRLRRGARLLLASHNKGKLAEIATLVRPHGVEVISAAEFGLEAPDEDAPDFAGNARIKALAAAQASGLPALSDDSGFCVAALDGAPGVLSARWAEPGHDFAGAMARVQKELARKLPGQGPGEESDRRAWFVCALCLGWPDGHADTFVGRVDGAVCWPPRGDRGFGYDPMFVPDGQALTFGEMTQAEKHAVSHRARAFAQLLAACLG
jgi:XTP/dITP diphosphohydrolase